jgi:secreted protein with Ig-like and vWFA domain
LNGVSETITASGDGNTGVWFGDVVVGSGSLTSIGNTTRTGFTGDYWQGDIYEILAVNKEKTTPTQVTKIVNTTKRKYGIQ